MGYKAEIKRLNATLEVKKRQTDILYAALKKLVIQEGEPSMGENNEVSWCVSMMQFDPEEVNKQYTITTNPVAGDTPEEDMLVMTVTENK